VIVTDNLADFLPAAMPTPLFRQSLDDFLLDGGVLAGAGGLDRGMRVAQDGDDVPGPTLDAAGTEFRDRPAASAMSAYRSDIS
jgi:hypothetical protein